MKEIYTIILLGYVYIMLVICYLLVGDIFLKSPTSILIIVYYLRELNLCHNVTDVFGWLLEWVLVHSF